MKAGGSLAAAALALALAGCAPAQRPAVREPTAPSPLAGPGVPETPPTVRQAVTEGWQALVENRPDAALAASRRGRAAPAAVLLAHAVAFEEGGTGLVAPLRELTRAHPGWAAAWATLSLAAEREGDEVTALAAARRTAELWPVPRWRDRAARLRLRYVERRAAAAREALATGDAATAADLLRRAVAADPSAGLQRELARALVELGDLEGAERLLAPLLDDPRALELSGRAAALRGDWAAAMERYRRLPRGWPGRDRLLQEARLWWRLDNLPAYVHEALRSPALTRAQLAVLVVALAPEVEAAATGPAPLLPDVVGHRAQREILVCVRSGVLRADRITGTFEPGRRVTADEVRVALERLAAAMGRPVPSPCPGGSPCPGLPEPPTGEAVTRLLLQLQGYGGTP